MQKENPSGLIIDGRLVNGSDVHPNFNTIDKIKDVIDLLSKGQKPNILAEMFGCNKNTIKKYCFIKFGTTIANYQKTAEKEGQDRVFPYVTPIKTPLYREHQEKRLDFCIKYKDMPLSWWKSLTYVDHKQCYMQAHNRQHARQ